MIATFSLLGRLVAAVSVCWVFMAQLSFAHEDPAGDVHPSVRIENGLFAVYFSNNMIGDSNDRSLFRTVYSSDGQLVAPRHQVDLETMSGREPRSDSQTSRNNERTYSMPEYHRLHLGRPYYFVEEDGRRQRHKIPWTEGTDIDGVHDMVVLNGVMWIAGRSSDEDDLLLYHYPLESLTPPREMDLGQPTFIWSFPVASNLIVKNGACYIAWCRHQDGKNDLVLSKWDGVSDHTADTVLAEGVDFNLSIYMAATDGQLCVAYHRSRDGDYPGYSVIETVFRPLD